MIVIDLVPSLVDFLVPCLDGQENTTVHTASRFQVKLSIMKFMLRTLGSIFS